jgi:pantoate--beta-alanine ligase
MIGLIESPQEWRESKKALSDKTIGFVPTMGALHEGHLSLVQRSKKENDITVVSIYVNPTQFDNKEDLGKYPVSLDEDNQALEKNGVDFLFLPEYKDLYPDNYVFKVTESDLSRKLCGASRPGHFDGVLSVVMKLLNIIGADKAYFGEKDYQQYLLVKRMAEAFFLDTEIIPCSLVREKSGLALSSRNRRLSQEGRVKAAEFYKLLNSGKPIPEIAGDLEKSGFRVDYVEEAFGRIFGAIFLENVRLIDNVVR